MACEENKFAISKIFIKIFSTSTQLNKCIVDFSKFFSKFHCMYVCVNINISMQTCFHMLNNSHEDKL